MTKSPRRRCETDRLATYGWNMTNTGNVGKRPRFLYTSPTGDQVTSMKKAIAAAIRLNILKDTAAACEQLV